MWKACPVWFDENTTQFCVGCQVGYVAPASMESLLMVRFSTLPFSINTVPPCLARTWNSMRFVL